MTNGCAPVASARSWPGTTTPPSPSGSSASPRYTTIPVTRSATGGPATGRTATVSPTPTPEPVRRAWSQRDLAEPLAAGRPATVSTGSAPFRCSTDSSCRGARVVAEGRGHAGDDVQRGDAAVRDQLGHVRLASVDDGEVAGEAVALRGVDEPLQARLERHGRDDRHHGQPEPDDGRRGPDPARGPRSAPRQPDARQHRGPAAERGVTARRSRRDGPARARDEGRRHGRHRDEQQRERRARRPARRPRRPEPRCRLEPGLAAQRLDQPGRRGRPSAPATPAASAPTPPASTRATARSTSVIPSARSMRWTWRRPPWWRSSPWATTSSPPSPTTTPNTTSPARRTTWAARTVGSTPEVGNAGCGRRQAVQRRGVGVGGVGVGQRRRRRRRGRPGRWTASRTNTPRADTSAACSRAKAGVTIRSVTGSAQAGARAMPDHRAPGRTRRRAARTPGRTGRSPRASSRRRITSSPTCRPRSAAAGSLTRISSPRRRGAPDPRHDRLGEARRVVGAAAERDEPDGRGVDLGDPGDRCPARGHPGHASGPGRRRSSCAAGSRTCASARPVAAAEPLVGRHGPVGDGHGAQHDAADQPEQQPERHQPAPAGAQLGAGDQTDGAEDGHLVPHRNGGPRHRDGRDAGHRRAADDDRAVPRRRAPRDLAAQRPDPVGHVRQARARPGWSPGRSRDRCRRPRTAARPARPAA